MFLLQDERLFGLLLTLKLLDLLPLLLDLLLLRLELLLGLCSGGLVVLHFIADRMASDVPTTPAYSVSFCC